MWLVDQLHCGAATQATRNGDEDEDALLEGVMI
jgi:hypothetical protein